MSFEITSEDLKFYNHELEYVCEPGEFEVMIGPNSRVSDDNFALSPEYDLLYPAFVIGVPVGFVNVEAAKELIMETDVPYIINRGRKGGSNVAAAICNALLYELRKEQENVTPGD